MKRNHEGIGIILVWLVSTIRKVGDDGLSFAEINEKWLETDMSVATTKASSTAAPTAMAVKTHLNLKE